MYLGQHTMICTGHLKVYLHVRLNPAFLLCVLTFYGHKLRLESMHFLAEKRELIDIKRNVKSHCEIECVNEPLRQRVLLKSKLSNLTI
jgi:hypothetical protein